MKTNHAMLFMGLVFSSLVTTNTSAQFLTGALPASENSAMTVTSAKASAKSAKAAARLNKANVRALNSFSKHFSQASDAKWAVEQKVISATFNKDDIRNSVIYDKGGNWLYTMRTYNENKMPADIRQLVKRSIYFDYEIKLVQEIQDKDILFYVVHLEDNRTCKQITVYDGEIKLLNGFDKQ